MITAQTSDIMICRSMECRVLLDNCQAELGILPDDLQIILSEVLVRVIDFYLHFNSNNKIVDKNIGSEPY